MKWLAKYFWTITIVTLVVLMTGTVMSVILTQDKQTKQQAIDSFAECAAAGNPIAESYPETCTVNGKTYVNVVSAQSEQTTDTVVSGKKAFSVEVPRGWGPIVSAADGDQLMLNGYTQPNLDTSKSVLIIKTDAYGHDGPVVFMIGVFDAIDTSIPAGTASELTIGKGNDKITGTRYAYEYPEDTPRGLGERLKGDRDYQYRLTLKSGKTLLAHYQVYGADPRNLVNQFETMLESFKELK